jgi:hypothetical protein
MIGDQTAQSRIGVERAKVAGTIKRMELSVEDVGGVADIV